MKNIKILSIGAVFLSLVGASSCKKELQVGNPNQPTIANAATEPGIIALATGSIYQSGFNDAAASTNLNTLGSSYFANAIDFEEELADDVTSQDANRNLNVFNLPDYVTLDNGTKLINQSPQKANAKTNNTRATRASNAFYYTWAYMYDINNGCNTVLSIAPTINFSGNAAARLATIQAWCYFWKGFAYAKLGSLYYAGLINDTFDPVALTTTVSNTYVNSAAMIANSNKYFELAKTTLAGITGVSDYTAVLGQLIPSFCQNGNGGVLTQAMWTHTINTMEARNILANKLLSAMTATDWNNILTLTANGIQATDAVFTGRTIASNGFIALTNGTTAAETAGNNSSSTFVITERFIQDYKTGDQRFAENFAAQTYYNTAGGLISSSRWALVSGGTGAITGIPAGTTLSTFLSTYKPTATQNYLASVLADIKTYGNYQVWISGSYEENELMKAEALINTGQIDLGLASVDKIRVYQSAGLPAVSGTGLTLAQAKEELRRERRVGLVFRGVSFYDARRQGFIYDVTKGGGRSGCVVLIPPSGSTPAVLNVNAFINYDFIDYWDVPADEFVINPPGPGSAPIANPN